MKNDKYNNYNSGIKKVGNSYTIKQTNYQKSKNVNNNDILTNKIKNNVETKAKTYSKSLSIKIVKSPYTIAKGVYKLDKAINNYSSNSKKVEYTKTRNYTIKSNNYNNEKNNFLDKKYKSTRVKVKGSLSELTDKKLHINKVSYNFLVKKYKAEKFKNLSKNSYNSKLEVNFEYRSNLRFESKRPIDWNKAKLQRNIESLGLRLGKNKELKLRRIKDEKINKWISKNYRFREKIKGNIKNKALYPYKNTKSNFKETFKKAREGENEAARETIDKIQKQGKRGISLGKYALKRADRKIKFTKYQRIKSKQLSEKVERINSVNRFKKKNINKLNSGRFKGRERFVKKRKAIKKFKKNNRILLRQRLIDRLKFGIKDFFGGLKNPTKLFSTIFRMITSVKTILLIAIPFVIIASVFSSFGMQAKTHAVNEEHILVEQDSIFAQMHSAKYNEQTYLNEIKNKYPGYDSYSVDLSDVGYDNYELLAYLNIAYGNIEEDNKSEIMSLIRYDLQDIFQHLYTEKLEETRETKTEYTEEVKEDGTVEKVAKQKTYVYLKVKVVKTNSLKDIYLERLSNQKNDNWFFNEEIADEDIEEWFDALVKNKLGVSNLFAVTVNGNVAVSGIISREAFSSENSEFGEPKLNNIDPNGYGYAFGQCTWYAFQRRSEIGKPLAHSFFGDGGSWWITAKNLGMSVDHTPRPGDAASFPAGVAGALAPWGHVAFVEKVNPDGSIEISEMHGGNTVDGIIRYRHIPKEAVPYTYFIH
ncbi:CHAP domain-containing protein [Gemelliphila palaticanis]|nr:CHAP domain-containing protein [Gemella palaticanis]